MNAKTGSSDPLSAYELFILAITLIALALWFVSLLSFIDSQTRSISSTLGLGISLVFLGDFVFCLFRAESKRRYLLRRGWMDLLGSVPTLPLLRPLRLARAIQISQKISRAGRSGVLSLLRTNVPTAIFWTTMLLTVLLLISTSLLVLQVEMQAADATITTGGDALWWAISTVATVGFGDVVPVTASGRGLGVILMTMGVLFVSVLISYITTALFIMRRRDEARRNESDMPILRRLDRLEQELVEIKDLLARKEDRE